MTISSTTVKVSYSGNGSTTVFAYTFKILDDDEIQVIIRSSTGTETVKTKTTHYTVSGVGSAGGGNITFLTAPTATQTVVLRRLTTQTQETDYIANDPFPADSHEDALDRITMVAQEIQEELGRAIKLSKTNTITSTEFTVSATNRANKILAFDTNGEISVTQELGTYKGNWTTATAYYGRDIVKDTSNNNIYIANTAHTSTGSQPISTNADVAKWDLLVDAASASTYANAAANSSANSSNFANNSSNSANTSANHSANSSNFANNSSNSANSSSTYLAGVAANASNASNFANNSSNSANSASNHSSNSSNFANNSSNSANTSSNHASNSSNHASNSSNSANSASTSATTATTQAGFASSNAATATTQAGYATANATLALGYSSNSSNFSNNSSNFANTASNAANAANSARDAALVAADNFDDVYLGAKASAPTLDNDGDPLTAGDLYYNTVSNTLQVYSGSAWQAAAVSTAGFATLTGVETLTNKTLTTPVISSISNTGTLTLPTSTDTLVGRATTDTLTNKTLTLPTIDNIKIGYSTTATAAGTTTLTVSSNYKQYFTGSTTQTIVLPVVTTLTLGHTFEIHNNSSGSLTVNSSGSNLVGTIQANTTATCTCILITGTTAASWDFDITGFTSSLPVARGGTGLTALGTSLQVLRTNTGATALEFATIGGTTTPFAVTGDATSGSEIRLPEDTDNGSNYVALKAADNLTANLTLTLPSADGTSGQVLQTNGSGVLSFATVGGLAWQSIVTASTLTAVAGRGYWIDTTSNACTITLPASATNGDTIVFSDYARKWATNKITINTNSLKFQGNTTPNPEYNTDGQSVTLVYSGATQGWIPTVDDDVTLETPQSYSVDFLVVAGGGGGGGSQNGGGSGGGGAGGYRTSTQTVSVSTAITVTVGDGGAGGATASSKGTSGSDSSISGSGLTTITSAGGGGGGSDITNYDALNGGSGGGGGGNDGNSPRGVGGSGNTPSTSPSQGNAGGSVTGAGGYGAGGGGSGGVASNSAGGPSASGGIGTASSITGSSVTYATGGGGGNLSGTSGTANTGNGGDARGQAGAGGTGGKGVVILSMLTSKYTGTTTGSPTVTTSGSNTILKFTGSGSYTA